MSLYADLFARLADAGVRFIVVGGVAVVLQGVARLTADIDLVLDLDPDNVRRAIHALQAHGLQPLAPVNALDFADSAKRQEWIDTKNLDVFSMRDPGNPLVTVDLFARAPLPFEDLWSRADVFTIQSRELRVACIADLIAMKRIAGRPQDLLDIEKLERLEQERR